MGYQQDFLRGNTEKEKLSTLLSHTKFTQSFTVGKYGTFLLLGQKYLYGVDFSECHCRPESLTSQLYRVDPDQHDQQT